MAAVIIDGKKIGAEIRGELAEKVRRLKAKGITPGLAVILVGDDPASTVYVRNKERGCQEIGVYSEIHRRPANISQGELLSLIGKLNVDRNIHGILVQLPLPKGLDEELVMKRIRPEKDVDGFHPVNAGKLLAGQDTLLPCTPHGCMVLLERSGVPIAGAEAVVLGRSNIVGKPAALLLMQRNATVTICHSKTANLAEITRRADIIVAAVGRPGTLTGDMIKEGVAVIDVGINRVGDRLVGDVDFESVAPKAGWITPVPGGVGPMTITMLLANTVQAAGDTMEETTPAAACGQPRAAR